MPDWDHQRSWDQNEYLKRQLGCIELCQSGVIYSGSDIKAHVYSCPGNWKALVQHFDFCSAKISCLLFCMIDFSFFTVFVAHTCESHTQIFSLCVSRITQWLHLVRSRSFTCDWDFCLLLQLGDFYLELHWDFQSWGESSYRLTVVRLTENIIVHRHFPLWNLTLYYRKCDEICQF